VAIENQSKRTSAYSDLAKKLLALVDLEKMNSESWMHLQWVYGLLDLSIGHNHLFTGHILLLNQVSEVLR
jgi:hypothetical protein